MKTAVGVSKARAQLPNLLKKFAAKSNRANLDATLWRYAVSAMLVEARTDL